MRRRFASIAPSRTLYYIIINNNNNNDIPFQGVVRLYVTSVMLCIVLSVNTHHTDSIHHDYSRRVESAVAGCSNKRGFDLLAIRIPAVCLSTRRGQW